MVKCSSSSCQRATGHGCVCICGHGNHGAKARLRWAATLAKEPSQRRQTEKADAELAKTQQSKAKDALLKQYTTLKPSRRAPRRDDANAFLKLTAASILLLGSSSTLLTVIRWSG